MEGEISQAISKKSKKHKVKEMLSGEKIPVLLNSAHGAGKKEFMKKAGSAQIPQQPACSSSDPPAEGGRLGADRRKCEGPLSRPLPPTPVREQRMGMSENALLPSLVRLQASARKQRGEAPGDRLGHIPVPGGLSSSAPSPSFFRPGGPGAWVDGGKPEASWLPEKDAWLMETRQTVKTLSTPGQV